MLLSVRKLATDDAAEMVSWLDCERDVLEWGGPYFDFPLTQADVVELISEHKGDVPSRECRAITVPDHAFLGTFQLAYNFRSGQVSLGRVLIRPEQRGKGHAKHLLQIAEKQAFRRPQINRLELRVFAHNKPAISAYKKAGFKVEGTARQSARLGSEYWDTLTMAKLRSERAI